MTMRKAMISLVLAGAVVAGGAGWMTLGGSSKADAQAAPTSQPSEHHPEIHAALRHLREAKRNLELAARDYDGHRKEALELTEKAIKQCEDCLKVDEK